MYALIVWSDEKISLVLEKILEDATNGINFSLQDLRDVNCLIIWSDQKTSYVPESCLKDAVNGKIVATFNGTEFNSARDLMKNLNKKETLASSGASNSEIIACNSASDVPVCSTASKVSILNEVSQIRVCSGPSEIPVREASKIPGCSGSVVRSYNTRGRGRSISTYKSSSSSDAEFSESDNISDAESVVAGIADTAPVVRTQCDQSVVSLKGRKTVAEVQAASPMMMELIRGSGVFLKTKDLDRYQKLYKNQSHKLALRLMRLIVGEEKLMTMSPSGRCPYKKIPRDVYDAVEEYVSLNAEPQLSSLSFQTKMKHLCCKIRRKLQPKLKIKSKRIHK